MGAAQFKDLDTNEVVSTNKMQPSLRQHLNAQVAETLPSQVESLAADMLTDNRSREVNI